MVLALLGLQPQPLDGLAVLEVTLHDFAHVTHLDAAIPDAFRIDDQSRTMLTDIQAPGFLRPDISGHAARGELSFEFLQDRLRVLTLAAPPHVSSGTLIEADKDMV